MQGVPKCRGARRAETYVERRGTRGTQQTSAYKLPACLQPSKAGQKGPDARPPKPQGLRRTLRTPQGRGARETPQMGLFHQPASLSLKP